MNATKVKTEDMAIEIVNAAENTQQLIDAVEALHAAAIVAAYRKFYSDRGEDNIATIKHIIRAIEEKHEQLLPDLFDAEEVDAKLIEGLNTLRGILK